MTLAVTTAGLAGCGASDKPAAQQESAGKTEAAETVSGETGSSEQAGGAVSYTHLDVYKRQKQRRGQGI